VRILLENIKKFFIKISFSLLLTISFALPSFSIDLANYDVIDLTHPLAQTQPADAETGGPEPDLRFSLGSMSGTYAIIPTPPTSAREVLTDLLIRPAVVINVEGSAKEDPDFSLDPEDIMRWEIFNGEIPSDSAVLVETGWDRLWGDETIYLNYDGSGNMHYPGISTGAARFLTEDRHVKVIGIDGPGIDPGSSEKTEAFDIFAMSGGILLLNLKNLRRLPPRGATIFIGVLPIEGASASPARVLAIIPKK
jgi:kynurenine formamidase